ncbi:hypothetical protein GLOTRDRAFT_137822 [Gloeophyllum trabeum ATCC 11539]|uniref:DUF803-domain-containing protein n=1 Tax=Gloeophyllum trabeum (strain ATCC 11539 / FP-39264 / Madison 617) TaxID=670483 RepID=S7QC92_GLOTA|nr:uncharacterized protein GLOTRDRAFT_137822 [Gloeophyllum trabeum ATCC 11539]EPQ57506.1 hypothetical protein GLOTRDRAFT_137822 [Gloeophyllum trabeum ATCC 11539]
MSTTPTFAAAVATVLQRDSPEDNDDVPARHASPVLAFIIGLSIILLASILNAAGLNLTKLDHVRTSAIPKASRRKDWLRPLWLLGMVLYILSQLIGSTLALEYMRAEYVAPLGSTSLIFNFLFARFLVGTPVTSTDIYGTIIVIVGVIGIVAFGSINSGLASETDVAHLTKLWTRGGWLGFFFFMAFALIILYVFTSQLDAVLSARSDLSAEPFAGMSGRRNLSPGVGFIGKARIAYTKAMMWIGEQLELWTAAKGDKQIAWTLGIGWACCGGGLAGGTLVFAKASVKLISGSLSHENPGNQFGHAASIFTFILLAATAVFQIICLNRGLKVYDSTLVVPVFYGVYTATGFLDSLIFNNEVDAYQSWTLFLIFVSILILISGVVLLTHKKPEPVRPAGTTRLSSIPSRKKIKKAVRGTDGEEEGLRPEGDPESREVVWQLGDASDDEDEDHNEPEAPHPRPQGAVGNGIPGRSRSNSGDEAIGLMNGDDETAEDRGREAPTHRRSTSSDATLARDEEFGEWTKAT